ncbi:MAG: UDP-glucose 4-epimerase GalE [Dehalococcoidia bacterium]|nr:UDP-glucose 4-epimerase GalE [Dehalococcoidia bacterium]MDD5493713.1 UDP-glucose 4-epimerase GalE [Dehalococcoidia bacterium]
MILVTGAAGYIGSILTEKLIDSGYQVVALDNLSKGHRSAVHKDAVFVKADIGDRPAINGLFQNYTIDAVMHLAADTEVERSFAEPYHFFFNNVASPLNLLDCMLSNNVGTFIFSSSAAVYGEPAEIPVSEVTPTCPINPYGETKLMFEKILHWFSRTKSLNSVALRYFNVAGASACLGEDHKPASTLIAAIIDVATGNRDFLPVFGNDYDTKDGTCIRDFIHVVDIADAHIKALQYLQSKKGFHIFNLGNGDGYSVMEVIEAARKVTGKSIPVKLCPRRPGDPVNVISSASLARSELHWKPSFPKIENLIESAWIWQNQHPQGYNDF